MPESVPEIVYPVELIVIPVPKLAEANENTGEPPKLTSSPDSTPLSVAVPEAVAAVVPSYTLLSPVKPVIVNSLEVMSPDNVGCVKV